MAGSEQRARGQKAGGRRIDDHSFWAGSKTKDSPLPLNTARRAISNSEGAGELMDYQDTEGKIHSNQMKAVSQIKKYQGRLPEYRN